MYIKELYNQQSLNRDYNHGNVCVHMLQLTDYNSDVDDDVVVVVDDDLPS